MLVKNIKKFLMAQGAPMHLKGFIYLCRALEIVINDYSQIFNLKKDVYSIIARDYHTTSSRVERDIRTVIEAIFTRGSREHVYEHFHYISDMKGKPTNKEYIATIANLFM